MSIPFGCACGKTLQAKDTFAGKKMRCPACSKLLTIPRPVAVAMAAPPPAAPDPPPCEDQSHATVRHLAAKQADTYSKAPHHEDESRATVRGGEHHASIPFACACGKKLQAKDTFAGKKIRCPACSKLLTIPSPVAVATAAPPPAAPDPPLREDRSRATVRHLAAKQAETYSKASQHEESRATVKGGEHHASIPFACTCGKKLQAKAMFAGKKMRCPACSKILTIPSPRTATTVGAPAVPASAAEAASAPAAPPLPMTKVPARPPRPVTKAPPPPVFVDDEEDSPVARAPAPPPPPVVLDDEEDFPVTQALTPPPPLPLPVAKAPPPPIVVDEDPGFQAEEPPPPPPPPRTPAVVNFPCDCGRRLKARRQDAGGEIDCPDCGRALIIPPEDTDEPPRAAPSAAAHPLVDPLLTQSATPWPDAETRRRGADGPEPRDEKAGSWLPTVVVLLLLLGGAGALWYFTPDIAAYSREKDRIFDGSALALAPQAATGQRHGTDLDWIPRDALSFVSFRPADLAPMAAAQGGKWTSLARTAQAASEQLAGLHPNQVQRLTQVMLSPTRTQAEQATKGREQWLLVTTTGVSVKTTVLEKLVPRAQRQTFRGHTYYVASSQQAGDRRVPVAVHFVNSKLFVVADADTIKRFFRPMLRSMRGPLAEAVKAAKDKKHHLVIGLNQTAFRLRPPGPVPAAELLDFRSGVVTVDEPSSARVDVRLEYDKAETAAQVHTAAALRLRILAADVPEEQAQLVRWRVAPVCQTVGSLALSALSPLGTLHVVPAPRPTDQEVKLARRLQIDEMQLRVPPRLADKSVLLTLPEETNLERASWVWLPYRVLAESVAEQRPPVPRPGGPRGGR